MRIKNEICELCGEELILSEDNNYCYFYYCKKGHYHINYYYDDPLYHTTKDNNVIQTYYLIDNFHIYFLDSPDSTNRTITINHNGVVLKEIKCNIDNKISISEVIDLIKFL